jgi:hypothetical protein
LREERRLRVERVLRRIFGAKREIVKGSKRATYQGDLFSAILTTYYSRDHIEKNEMGGGCGSFGRAVKCMQGFGGET